MASAAVLVRARGRSPRARGNPLLDYERRHVARSIPAGAGKPCRSVSCQLEYRVDPRGRGETVSVSGRLIGGKGRSPRARGNRVRRLCAGGLSGSIPAGAGKPSKLRPYLAVSQVDPRGRGETVDNGCNLSASRGRSPRARGNHAYVNLHSRDTGSIPAGRGETKRSIAQAMTSKGRSPRARGNPLREPHQQSPVRSIPAGAGKPSRSRAASGAPRVDPRGRGETATRDSDGELVAGRSPRARGNRR